MRIHSGYGRKVNNHRGQSSFQQAKRSVSNHKGMNLYRTKVDLKLGQPVGLVSGGSNPLDRAKGRRGRSVVG